MFNMIGYYLSYIFIFLLPLAVTAFFVTSLVLFCRARSTNKKSPGSFTEKQLKARGLMLFFSSVLFGAILLCVAFVFAIFLGAIAFM